MTEYLPNRRIEMADGTILDAEMGVNGNSAWIWFNDDTTMMTAMTTLCDTSKTARLAFTVVGNATVYEGFTVLTNVSLQDNGRVKARLINPAIPSY